MALSDSQAMGPDLKSKTNTLTRGELVGGSGKMSGGYGSPAGDPTDIGNLPPSWQDKGSPYSGTAGESPSTGSPWSADTADSPPAWTGAGGYRHYGAPVTSSPGIGPDGGTAEVRNQPGYTPETTANFNPIYPHNRGTLTPFSGVPVETRWARTGSGSLDATGNRVRMGGGGTSYGNMDDAWGRQRRADSFSNWQEQNQQQAEWEAEQDSQAEYDRERRASEDAYWQQENEEADRRSGGTQGNESETGERP